MFDLPESVIPLLIGFFASLGVSGLITVTKRWHGTHSFDSLSGPQKFHDSLVPRIGGIAVLTGFFVATCVTPQPIRSLLLLTGASGTLTFLSGLAEDLTGKVSATLRLTAAFSSGLLFCLLTNYSVTSVEIPYVNDLLQIHLLSLAITAFAMAGLANAINIIDGFNGMAVGSVTIMLFAFTFVAIRVGDQELAFFTAVIIAASCGFLLVNFPAGFIFLGDGGAYFLGFLLAAVSVLLVTRNPDVSPWLILLILAYPVIETIFSILRKTVRSGYSPMRPDDLHLHMLVYKQVSVMAEGVGSEKLANPVTGILMWLGPLTSLILVMFIPYNREWSLLGLLLQALLYGSAYYCLLKASLKD